MFRLPGWIKSNWPIVRVSVAAHPQLALGPQRTLPLDMLIDTGANQTHVPEKMLQTLGLAPSDTKQLGTSAPSSVTLPTYWALTTLTFFDLSGRTHPVSFFHEVVGRQPTAAQKMLPYEGILGVDILRYFRLVVDTPANEVLLSCHALPTGRS